jgi:hypothetical protein
MDQSDDIGLFIDRNQSGTHRDHVFNLCEVSLVKFGLANFYCKGVLKL